MNETNRFVKFEQAYKTAISTIERFMEPGGYEPEMYGLVKWMLDTDANPYAYLPVELAGALDSAQGFASLLHYIHHALYDDGDITFVTVNGEPRIVFANQYDEGFRDRALSPAEKDIESRPVSRMNVKCDIQVLDIKPNLFGPIYDMYQRDRVRHWFINDAASHGIEYAVKHYEKYKCFDLNWIADCEKEIEENKKKYAAIRKAQLRERLK